MSKKNSEIEALKEEIELMLLKKIKEGQFGAVSLYVKIYKEFKEAVREYIID